MTEQCWLLLLLSRLPSPFNFQALFSFAGYWLGVQSSCLSFLEFPAPTPFFLASFSNAYFLPISPASHPFRTPTSRFFPAPIPIPLLPLLSWAPPPYSPTMGASCRHSYYLLILIVAKFLPSPLNLSATQLFTRPHSIGCENNRYRNTAMTLSPKQWSCVLWRTNEIRGFKSCVLTAWTGYAAWPKRFGSRGLVTPFRLGHVAEVNWLRRPGKTL